MLSTHCAVYTNAPADEIFGTGGGTAGYFAAGQASVAGLPNAADGGRYYGGAGSTSVSGGSGRIDDGAPVGGGTNVASAAGAGGVSSAGTAGATSGGGGGANTPVETGGVVDRNVSEGKPAATDSEQSHQFHYASDGNDGDRSTRWCATDWRANHYWKVDLGKSYQLSFLHILWEKAAPYRFKVESSPDDVNWSVAVNEDEADSALADEAVPLPVGTTGRYVRITVTGGLTTTVWASFYEVEVFGH